MGINVQGRLVDLGGDNDTLTIGVGGPTTQNISLNLANVENINSVSGSLNVFMQSVLTGTTVDLGVFNDRLDLANGNNVVTTINVETVNAFGTGNDTVTYVGDPTIPGSVNLGGGTNVLKLAGANSDFSLQLFGSDLTVFDQTLDGNIHVTLSNTQAGTTFDFGGGSDDSLTLFTNGTFGNGVSVRNVENVVSNGTGPDAITILGNSGGVTTVTAGSGPDIVTASNDEDHFRFITTGDSPNINGQRDVIDGFDAAEDKFVFDLVTGDPTGITWELITFGGAQIVRVDLNNNHAGDVGWEMAFELPHLTGTLTNDNFLIV
jgi:hypothetical protein